MNLTTTRDWRISSDRTTAAGGFVAGYYFRELFPPITQEDQP
jgi:hypothetical protein